MDEGGADPEGIEWSCKCSGGWSEPDMGTPEELTPEEFLARFEQIICDFHAECGHSGCSPGFTPDAPAIIERCQFNSDQAEVCIASMLEYVEEQSCFTLGPDNTVECQTVFYPCEGAD